MITILELIEITKPKVLQLAQPEGTIIYLITDSRKVSFASSALFFAINGHRHDGHKYIKDLYKQGVRNFIVESEIDSNKYPNSNFFLVKNSIAALQQIAAFHRSDFADLPVVSITGSNAKTIVKEWLSEMLEAEYVVVKNPKSYNSQIGVPLSVWQIAEKHTFGVFEAGISKVDEMGKLQKIIQPNYGIFTNIGTAHNEGFADIQQKIIEKSKLFSEAQKVIFCSDHTEIKFQLDNLKIPTYSWSQVGNPADVSFQLENIQSDKIAMRLERQWHGNIISDIVEIPFHDVASIENVLHCITFLCYLGKNIDVIKKSVKQLKPISMRLELKQAIGNSYLIDDTYNNDLAGLTMALDFLVNQNQKTHKAVILSDVLETGMDENVLYMLLAETLKEKNITTLIGIGSSFCSHAHYFNTVPITFFYPTTDDFLIGNCPTSLENKIILVKGARVFQFEKIIKKLEQKSHRTVFEINLDALSHNLNYYRNKISTKTKIMVMVKSFAYGAGNLEVANLLQFHRVDYLCVAYTDEGVTLRQAGITIPIMVLNVSAEDFELLATFDLEPVIYSQKILENLVDFLEYKNLTMAIHLEIETGMHRLGIAENEITTIGNLFSQSKNLIIASVFSHLAGADEAQFEEYTHLQYGKLLAICSILENKLKYKFLKHILNSAGIVRYPEMHLDMVRLGIGLYGIEANGLEQANLQNVSTLKTIITQIKNVNKGDSIGYARKGIALKDTTIGIIAIGYGDGYSRSFSNGVGKVLINNTLVPVIGNVCMDMTMVDITDVSAKEGDEVIVFGKDIDISQVAKSIGTIPYEIFTNVSERVKRVFYTE